MKKNVIASGMIMAVLIAAMSAGFMSCSKDNKEPEPEQDLSGKALIGKWFLFIPREGTNSVYFIEFKPDMTFSYVTENETVNGNYRITETKKQTLVSFVGISNYVDFIEYPEGDGVESGNKSDVTLYKMLTSGSSVFDQLFVYFFDIVSGYGSVSGGGSILVQAYSGNQRVRNLTFFTKNVY